MEKYTLKQAAIEAKKIKGLVGNNPTAKHYDLADKYFEDIRAVELEDAANKRERYREIQKFVVTPKMWKEALNYYHEHTSELINKAIVARDGAVSHRDPPFQVGCAVLGIEPNGKENRYGIYPAYNFKIEPGPKTGRQKRCAERGGLEMAQEHVKVVVAIVIASRETSTGDPTKASLTLHPCKDCRMMYRDMLKRGFIKEDTILCGINDSNHEIITKERTVKELLDLYPEDIV